MNKLLGLVISLAVMLAVIFSNWIAEEAWNDGYCHCGGKYAYEQIIGGPLYLYECDKCGHVYESTRRMRRSK